MVCIIAASFFAACATIKEQGGLSTAEMAYGKYKEKTSSQDSQNSSEQKSKKKTSSWSGAADDGDAQFIQSDDYFISSEAYKSQTYIYVTLAKMITKPGAQTKNEAQFMAIADGKESWTKIYWKTKIAAQSDIKLGTVVISFNDNIGDEEIYNAPEDKDTARREAWFMAKVTDTSDLHRGYVTVSGGYKVSVDNLRIPVKVK